MSGFRPGGYGDDHVGERENREMMEIDPEQQHQQRQQQQFQDSAFSPYGPPSAQSYQVYSPYDSQDNVYHQGRSVTDSATTLTNNSSAGSSRPPIRPGGHADDYSYNPAPPVWPLSADSSPNPQHHYFAETPGDSRSATPTLQSGQATPMHKHPNSSVDWRPSSLMNQSHLSLAALLPGGGNGPNRSSTGSKEYVDQSAVQQVQKRDDKETWSGWKRNLFKLAPFLTIANTLIYLAYLALRIACVIWAQEQKQQVFAAAWVFIAVELATAIPSLMHNCWTMWSMKKRQRAKLRLVGVDVPTVDVFVTCCGEEDDLVMDTVRAACDVDYPRDRFRVIILDDGKSAGLEAQAAKLAYTYPNLHYMARIKIPGQPHHFKAGNLNYGLDQVHLLPGGAGTYMAALDADMIPERDWLRAILPHLVIDPKMALACPPQLFYNTPPSDPLAQSLDFFVHVIEPIKDALGVAWCTGSGYVVRREALDQIGNFPLGSLAEDVATSTLMLGKGWKTAFIHEPLQFGTVPEDYGSHLKQRTRWAIGTVDTSFKLKFCLYGDKVKQMTFAQRFSGFLYASLSIYTILLTISLFAIPIILAMGKPLVAFASETQLRWLIRTCFASVIVNRLCEFVLFMPAGYHTGQRGSRYQLWMSPYIALCIVRSFILPSWLGGQAQAFKPTGSLGSALNERDAKNRKNMFRRIWGILFNYMAFFHMGFVYFTLVGVVLTSFRNIVGHETLYDTMIGLLTHAFWPPLTFLFICSSMWTPISYAIDPPAMPDREELLERDPKTQIAHPTAKSKKIAFGGQAAWFELEYTTTTIYTCLVFAASFFVYNRV